MLAENGLDVDMDAVNEVLNRADVLTIGFTTFSERLLIDARANSSDGPMVAIVGPVGTVQERYHWLGRHRPGFGAPEAFSFFVWPHTVRTFRERDIIGPMRERLAAASGDAATVLEQVLQRLGELETDAFRAAIRGEQPWHALWERAA
ncbi:hypothetical protein AYO38_08965 [bacterium SCGC AG-212-C10]|nr:hypothetical protein AYO38_08965 [bacterium SCGC AG-212-C10]